jgi:hypothetical protein
MLSSSGEIIKDIKEINLLNLDIEGFEIDILEFDQEFLSLLGLIASILTIIGIFMLRPLMEKSSMTRLIVILSITGSLFILPSIAMFYGFHEYTSKITNGVELKSNSFEKIDVSIIENLGLDDECLGELNFENSTTLVLTNDSQEDVKIHAIPLLSDPSRVVTIVSRLDKTYSFVLAMNRIGQDEYSYDLICSSPYNDKAWNNWGSCMHDVLNSHVGDIVTVAGVAGGLGCVPCAGVAGFFVGVSAIGCLG